MGEGDWSSKSTGEFGRVLLLPLSKLTSIRLSFLSPSLPHPSTTVSHPSSCETHLEKPSTPGFAPLPSFPLDSSSPLSSNSNTVVSTPSPQTTPPATSTTSSSRPLHLAPTQLFTTSSSPSTAPIPTRTTVLSFASSLPLQTTRKRRDRTTIWIML